MVRRSGIACKGMNSHRLLWRVQANIQANSCLSERRLTFGTLPVPLPAAVVTSPHWPIFRCSEPMSFSVSFGPNLDVVDRCRQAIVSDQIRDARIVLQPIAPIIRKIVDQNDRGLVLPDVLDPHGAFLRHVTSRGHCVPGRSTHHRAGGEDTPPPTSSAASIPTSPAEPA